MISRRHVLAAAATLPLVRILSAPAWAATDPVFSTNGIAIHGYDPVAYFTEGKPVEGSPEFISDWQGAELRFASADNKATFDSDPDAFAPKYGGYCAYAVSKGATATTDPFAWSIHENRLYLNFSTGVRDIWRQDIPGNIAAADANWPGVLNA